MGTKLNNVGALAVGTETTRGTAETQTTANAIMEDAKLSIEVESLARNAVRNVAAPRLPYVGSKKVSFSGRHPFRGSGTAGTAHTSLTAILKAAGFAVTNEAALLNRYIPVDVPSTATSSVSVKGWEDGIYVQGRGVMGNVVIELTPGDKAYANFTGMGALQAEGEATTPSPATDTPVPPSLGGQAAYLLEVNQSVRQTAADGTAQELVDGAASNLKFAVTITGAGKKIKYIALRAKKNGTPANETNGIELTIQGDAAGDPDGTPITNGSATAVASTAIGTTEAWYIFEFATPPTLTNATVYHIVWEGDWDADADNNIQFATDAVAAGSQNSQYYDAAWAALSEKNFSILVLEAPATGVDLYFADKIELDMGAKADLRMHPGSSEGISSATIRSWEPVLKITPLEVTDTERDFFDYLESATELAFRCDLGSTAGNKFRFLVLSCKARPKTVEHGDAGGEMTHPLELQVETPSMIYIEER